MPDPGKPSEGDFLAEGDFFICCPPNTSSLVCVITEWLWGLIFFRRCWDVSLEVPQGCCSKRSAKLNRQTKVTDRLFYPYYLGVVFAQFVFVNIYQNVSSKCSVRSKMIPPWSLTFPFCAQMTLSPTRALSGWWLYLQCCKSESTTLLALSSNGIARHGFSTSPGGRTIACGFQADPW